MIDFTNFVEEFNSYSVTYEKECSNYFLRIVIDRDEIIDIDTCVEVTNIINPLLDSCDILAAPAPLLA